MVKFELTPISVTVLFILLAVAIGTMVIGWSDLKIGGQSEGAKVTAESFCDPANALKMKYINNEISQEQYENMKAIIGVE
jgi:hypothetical protein